MKLIFYANNSQNLWQKKYKDLKKTKSEEKLDLAASFFYKTDTSNKIEFWCWQKVMANIFLCSRPSLICFEASSEASSVFDGNLEIFWISLGKTIAADYNLYWILLFNLSYLQNSSHTGMFWCCLCLFKKVATELKRLPSTNRKASSGSFVLRLHQDRKSVRLDDASWRIIHL